MPVNTIADMCQVWAHVCQYNGRNVPSASSMPVNTMADMSQVPAVCLLSKLGPLLLKPTKDIPNALILHLKASLNSLNNLHQNISRL